MRDNRWLEKNFSFKFNHFNFKIEKIIANFFEICPYTNFYSVISLNVQQNLDTLIDNRTGINGGRTIGKRS